VKVAAERLGLPVLQPEKAKDPAFLDEIRAFGAEVGIVVAYGKLLPRTLLSIPRFGFLNVHFSLLPAYRGAAPIQWTLINGEQRTGVSLFWLDEGMDTGPLLLQKETPIDPSDDAESLRARLVALGVEALEEALSSIARSGRTEKPQSGESSRAPMLTKEDGHIRWTDSAQQIVNRMRGTTPWPGTYAILKQGDRELRLKIVKAAAIAVDVHGEPGAVVRLDGGKGFQVKCGHGLLDVTQVQPEGKKAMSAWDFWQGARLKLGDLLH
jgi:methionyl-tRNA formyltransferase